MSSTWFMIALSVVGMVNLGFHVVVSRLLGPAAYSAFGSLLALLVLMAVPATGFQTLVTARVAALVESGRPLSGTVLFRRALVVGVAGTAVMLALAPALVRVFRLDSVVPVLWPALYCMPLAAITVPWAMLCGRRRFGTVGTIAILSTVVRVASAVLLIRAGLGLSGALASSVIADSLQAYALYRASGRLRPDGAADAVPLRVNVRATAYGGAAFFGLWLLSGIDTIAARLIFTPVAAGRYSAAATALHASLYAAIALSIAALPRFAVADVAASRRALVRVLIATAAITVPAMGLMAVIGPWLVPFVFGPTFAVSGRVTALIATATASLAMLWVLVQYNIARGRREAGLAWLGLAITVVVAARWHTHTWMLAAATVGAVLVPLALCGWSVARYRPAPRRCVEPLAEPTAALDLTVVVPFYNPGPSLRPTLLRLVDELRACGMTFEVVAVDDGSTDRSGETIADLDPGVARILVLPENQGKGSALRAGLRVGRGRYLGFIDADGDLDPALWRSFAELVRLYHPDGIVGDKRHPLTTLDSGASWTRNVCSFGYRWLVRLLFPTLPIRDTQVGLKVFRRDVLAEVLPRCVERRFVLDVELLALAARHGYRRILSAPISLYRVDRSTVTARAVVGMFRDTLALAWRLYVRNSYDLGTPPGTRLAEPDTGRPVAHVPWERPAPRVPQPAATEVG